LFIRLHGGLELTESGRRVVIDTLTQECPGLLARNRVLGDGEDQGAIADDALVAANRRRVRMQVR
jgi:hypothetical protein